MRIPTYFTARMSFFLALISLLIVAACSQAQLATHVAKQVPSGSEGNFKVGNPYQVGGKWYTPQETYQFTETGIASWYGPQFHGKKTANGERFDMHELTAAHRTLQLPSLVRVTNLDNGRSLIVRVNDRGPFKRGRVIDLSMRAAELLGFKNHGTAKVKLQVLSEESKAIALAARRGEDTRGIEVAMNERPARPYEPTVMRSPEPRYKDALLVAPVEGQHLEPIVPGHIKDGNFFPDPVVQHVAVGPSSIYVQVGAFSQEGNAVRLAENLRRFGRVSIYPAQVGGATFHRVRIGPLSRVEEADALLARLASSGYDTAITVVD